MPVLLGVKNYILSKHCSAVSYSLKPHGILQARILEWVTVPFSRGSSQPRGWTQVSRIASILFISWVTRETYAMLQII